MAINLGDIKASELYFGDIGIQEVYYGSTKIFPMGNTVTYYVDTGVTYQEDIDEGASCLSPSSFAPGKPGWSFMGWRTDNMAAGTVLQSLPMGNSPITLYAVFKRAVALSYDGNESTGGNTAQDTSYVYYNNGNSKDADFWLDSNGFSKTGYNFACWEFGGSHYMPGEHVSLSEDAVFYAVWSLNQVTPSNSSIKDYINVQVLGADPEANITASKCSDHKDAPEFHAWLWNIPEGKNQSDDCTFIITPKAPYSNIKATLHWDVTSFDGEDGTARAWVNGSELSDQEYVTIEGSSITIRLYAEVDAWEGHYVTDSGMCIYDVTMS